ncbi:myb-like protein I [Portunus trituberculatus]|uniref:myb-like protein I n=1 Tax=Portunus trituberculatus TaxID=210409 RepID=UPI001E1CEBA1|nr:myb-like protein I [Portunus trituberculatus]
MIVLLIFSVLAHSGVSAMGGLRHFGPYGHPLNKNNNPNNNYNYNNHIYNQPTTPQHNSQQNPVKVHQNNNNNNNNRPTNNNYQNPDCHNHHHHLQQQQQEQQQLQQLLQQQYHQFKAQEEKRKFENTIRKIFSERKMDTSVWDRLFGHDASNDLENDLTTLHDLSAKFGVYHLLPDDLKMRRDDLTRSPSSYTSYMEDSQDSKGFPGMDFYSIFAFAIFFSTITYAIFFFLQQNDEEKRSLDSSPLSVLQGSLVRVVTEALERWRKTMRADCHTTHSLVGGVEGEARRLQWSCVPRFVVTQDDKT